MELGRLAAILAAAYAAGALVLADLDFDSFAEALAFRTGAGLAILSCLVLAIAAAHSVRLAPLIVAILAFLAVLLIARRRSLGRLLLGKGARAGTLDPASWLAALAAAVLAAPALYPPHDFDAIMYHLPFAQLHIAQNALGSNPYLHLNFMPQAWELLDTLCLLVGTDVTAQLLHAAAMGLVAAACIGAARRSPDGSAAGWAGALWLASPVVPAIGAAAYNDVGLTLFVVLGIVAVGRWLETDSGGWLAAGGFLLGMAASTKYIGVVFLGLAWVAALAVSIRRKRLGPLAGFSAIALAVFAPWLARTWMLTGTPFGYFFAGLFGYGKLDPQDAVKLVAHMRLYGFSPTVGNFLLLPWDLLASPARYLEAPRISLWLLLGLPLALAGALADRRARWLSLVALVYTAVWFVEYQNPRFLLPVLPMLAVSEAVGAASVMERMGWKPPWRRAASFALAAAVLVPAVAGTLAQVRQLGPVPATPQARDAFLRARVAGYDALKRLNDERGGRYAVYSLLLPSPVYFARGQFVGDWFGPHRYEEILPLVKDPDRLRAKLRSFGITHLLVNKPRLARVERFSYGDWKRSLGVGFRSVYDDPLVEVFDLTGPGASGRGGGTRPFEILAAHSSVTRLEGCP